MHKHGETYIRHNKYKQNIEPEATKKKSIKYAAKIPHITSALLMHK